MSTAVATPVKRQPVESSKLMTRLPLESFRKGVASPTETIRGGLAGYLFDADNEVMTLAHCVPMDWDEGSDLVLTIYCILDAAEAENDLIDWETSVISVADHEDADIAGTQTPGASHNIGANNAAGTLHRVEITLDYDDLTCPIAMGDTVSIELSRTANVGNAGYVAGVVVIHTCIEYQLNKLGAAP